MTMYIRKKAKSSHFDRTRGDKNQIFPTFVSSRAFTFVVYPCGLHGKKLQNATKVHT